MKKLLILLLVLVAVILIALFAKDAIIKASVEKSVEMVTGLTLKIESLHVGILKPEVGIKNLTLLNPAGFSDRTMVDMPEIYVNYDLPAIIGGKIHLPEVRLALKEFMVVKNAQGALNLDALRTVQAHKEGKAPSQKAPGKAPEIRIDTLKLSIGKVIYKDYSQGATPDVKEFDINLNETYTDINDPYKLVSLIVVRALMNTSIAALTNFDLQGLEGSVGEALEGAQKAASEAAATAQKAASEAAATAQEAAKEVAETTSELKQEAQDTVTNATDTMKGLLKNPFESSK